MLDRLVRVSGCLALLWAGCCAGMAGTVAYDSFGPGLTTDNFYNIGGAPNSIWLTPFVPTATVQLESVVVPLFNTFPAANPPAHFQFSLWSDAAGTVGALLESWDLGSLSDSLVNVTLPSVVQPVLAAGSSYWAGVSPTNSFGWGFSNSAPAGGIWFAGDFGFEITPPVQLATDVPVPAFQLSGAAVPEPATWTLLLAGTAILIAKLSPRRSPAPVPVRRGNRG